MTTAISTVSTVRIAAAAAGLAGALVLTACSGGDSKDDSSSTPSASATSTSAPTSTASADSGGSTGSSPSAVAAELQGSWLATTDGKAVALVVTGTQAALFTTGGSICSGTAGKEAGMQMIHLKCTDKSTARATGMVGSVSKSGLSVTWSGSLGKETYTKAEGGKLPSGLPTAGLGS
ncbi:hypothetical protein AB0I51_35475 [Streptomyces sp. NPDC050549]|uniref:hypothetical protein n=1 Tax=Streptomyces sp. NPDC050549 TaxID=3155406 RepID=UPI003417DB61